MHYLRALQLLSCCWRKITGEESWLLLEKISKFYQNFSQKAEYFWYNQYPTSVSDIYYAHGTQL